MQWLLRESASDFPDYGIMAIASGDNSPNNSDKK